ncbi:MAG: hypothetical protein ACRDOF_00470, partial [Gaiellaceae bacterium]
GAGCSTRGVAFGGVTPHRMRRFAVEVMLIGAFAAGLGIANLASGFIGGHIWTVVAFAGTICAVGLAVELWYVSRRIERVRFANRNANPS